MRKGFYWLSESYYYDAARNDDIIDEIMIGDYPEGGGTGGEFAIRWTEVGGEVTPRLESFEDSWRVLADMPELLDLLAAWSGENPSPAAVADALIDRGYVDLTKRENPRVTNQYPHTVTIAWGSESWRASADPEDSTEQNYRFETRAELDAFMLGAYETEGYHGFEVVEDSREDMT